MNNGTVFQNHLTQRTVPWHVIRQRLKVHRSAPSHWARGSTYPNKPNADALITLFAEHDVVLDYNDIYLLQNKAMEKAS